MTRLVVLLARFSARHRTLVLVAWAVLAVGLLAGSRVLGSGLADELSVPGSDSAAASPVIAAVGGDAPPDDGPATSDVLVAVADGPIADRADDVGRLRDALGAVDGVTGVTERPVAGDTTATRLAVTAADDVDRRALAAAVAGARADGLEVGVGYPLLRDLEPGLDSRASEVVGVVAAVLVLLLVLGTVAATAVPIVSALVGVACGLSVLRLLGDAVAIPTVVPTLATMIGLGVGIDYALFQVARHRDAIAAAPDRVAAAEATALTAGEAVAFAGTTVAVAISALAVTGVGFVSWLGFGTAIVVVVVLTGSLTLTPALVAAAGPRLVRRSRRGAPGSAPCHGNPSAGLDTSATDALDATRWARLGAHVVRRPWRWLAASLAVLGVLAAPAVTLTLGQSSDADRPVGSERRTTYDLTSDHLGEGSNASLVVAVRLDPSASAPTDPRLSALAAELTDVPGVAAVAAPQLADDGSAALVRVRPTTGPADAATADAVAALRALDPPDGVVLHVGGATATRIDLSERIAARLPWLVLATVAVAAVLLVGALRSLLLPLKAALMDLVSVGAAYGVVTAVFEWGWGARALGLDGPVAIDSYVPMLLFAVLFGLSMDYEVFLLAAVRGHWRRSGRNGLAVQRGLAETGGIITAAAAIMLAVFGSFVLVDDPVIKVFGVGLAVAVVVDATVVRCVLGPAAMALMGRWNWWLPRWLDRVVPGAPSSNLHRS